MSPEMAVDVCRKAIQTILLASAPMLIIGMVIGLLVSIFQAVTQLQEPTLTFIPKILAVVVVIVVAGPWMMNTLLSFTIDLWSGIPSIGPD